MNPRILHQRFHIPQLYFESEQKSITVLCLLWSHYYKEVQIKTCLKSTQSSHYEKLMPCAPVIVWDWSIHYPPLSAMFDSLHSSTNQELFENHLCNKSSHYEKYKQFLITQRKPLCATTKLMPFTVSKDECNTKEDTGKFLKNTLHVLSHAKRYLLGWSDVKSRQVALAVIELCWSEGIG